MYNAGLVRRAEPGQECKVRITTLDAAGPACSVALDNFTLSNVWVMESQV